jgi:hypothetical protein
MPDKKPIPWTLILIALILILAMFLLGKYCSGGSKKVINTTTADSTIIAQRAADIQYTKDSLAFAEEIASNDRFIAGLIDDKALLTVGLLESERRIKQLIGTIPGRPATGDPRQPANNLDSCKELALEAERLVRLNEDNRITQANIDLKTRRESQIQDSIIKACERARLSGITNFNALTETYNKLKAENRRSGAQLYAGLTGMYSPVTQGAGATVMLKTNNDILLGGAAYITNSKPLYEARALIKISFRKK